MRWPWERRKAPPLAAVLDDDDPTDPSESTDALRRAQEANREAASLSDAMRKVTGSIHRERQRDNFSGAIFDSMKRKES